MVTPCMPLHIRMRQAVAFRGLSTTNSPMNDHGKQCSRSSRKSLGPANDPIDSTTVIFVETSRWDVSPVLIGMTVTQQFPWRRACTFIFSKRLNTVDDDRAIALCALYPPPFAAGQIMYDLTNPVWFDAETIDIVDYDISPRSFTE